MNNTNDVHCPHSNLEWIDPDNHSKRSDEYQVGYFKKLYCIPLDEICPFKDCNECNYYIKKEKE